MSQDNVRLALWISGIWGGLIILIVGAEAIVHDGNIAITIVDTFSKVLFGLGTILGVITGVGKFFETSQVNTAAAVASSAPTPVETPSDAAGASAVAGPGVD